MKNQFKKLFLITGLFCSVSLFAAEAQEEKDYDQGHGVQEHQIMGAYSAPARFDVKGSLDLFITLSFIYWQPIEENLYLAYTAHSAPTTRCDKIYDMNFKFKPGFKVGLGINLNYDNWNLYLEYLRLHSTHKKRINSPSSGSLYCLWRDISPLQSETVSSSWDFDTDLLDLLMARPYYLGTKLTLKPHAGLRSGWIDQKLSVKAIDLTDHLNKIFDKADTWLIGPRCGIEGFWHLGEGFKIFTNIAASLFYQHFKTKLLYFTSNAETIDYCKRKKNSRLTPNIDLSLGLAWGSYFADDDWHIDLSAGYEFHYFWNQNTLRSMHDLFYNVVTPPADLMLQGLTISARLDF